MLFDFLCCNIHLPPHGKWPCWECILAHFSSPNKTIHDASDNSNGSKIGLVLNRVKMRVHLKVVQRAFDSSVKSVWMAGKAYGELGSIGEREREGNRTDQGVRLGWGAREATVDSPSPHYRGSGRAWRCILLEYVSSAALEALWSLLAHCDHVRLKMKPLVPHATALFWH